MSLRVYIFLLFFVIFWQFVNSYEYCKDDRQKELCGTKRHIYCHPEQMEKKRLADKTPEGKLYDFVPMTKKLKRLLREMHNYYRNELACGKIRDNTGNFYPKASRMREVIWDDELAFLAKKHAELCTFADDECRNTLRFKYSGQNVAYFSKQEFSEIIPMIKTAVAKWFNESHNIIDGKSAAKLYPPSTANSAPFEHFTVIANDYLSRIGCAMSVCEHFGTETPWHFLLTCNYDMQNTKDFAMYKSDDESAIYCDYWENKKSDTYPCLCENNGNMKYDISHEFKGQVTGKIVPPEVEQKPNPTKEPTEDTTKEHTARAPQEPTEGTTVKPTEGTTVKPTEGITVKPTKETTEKPTEEITVKPTKETTEKPTEGITVKPTKETTEKPTEEITVKPTKETTEKPTEGTTEKPTEGTTAKPGKPDRPEEEELDKRPQDDYKQLWCTGDKQKQICPESANSYQIVCHPEKHAEPDQPTLIKMIDMTKDLRTMILDLHSKYRNEIACGNVKDNKGNSYPIASRQRVLMWDWELAYTAEFHAKQCIFKRDNCRNTLKYRYCGQNIGVNTLKKSNKTPENQRIEKEITSNLKLWFQEHMNVYNGTAIIKKYDIRPGLVVPRKLIGHFIQMSQDYNSRIGCGMSLCFNGKNDNEAKKFRTNQWLFTCNYDMVSAKIQVYQIGKKVGDNCSFWGENEMSETYPCLCKNDGSLKQYSIDSNFLKL